MADLDERVAALEVKVAEHGVALTHLHDQYGQLRSAIGELRAEVIQRFEAVDRRFEAIDRRFEAIDRRFDGMDRRFDAMERRFAWVVGVVITGFVTVIGTIAGAFWGLLQVVRG